MKRYSNRVYIVIAPNNSFFQINILLISHENICREYSFEVPHWGISNEYPRHIFLCRNKKKCNYFFCLKITLPRAMTVPPNMKWSISVVCCLAPGKHFFSSVFGQKVLIFFLFLHEKIHYGYSFKAPRWGALNEYPQCMFSCRYKKNDCLVPFLSVAMFTECSHANSSSVCRMN